MGSQKHKRDNSRYCSKLSPIGSRSYEISVESGKSYLSVPREDLDKLGLVPSWNPTAFISYESRRSWAGEIVYLSEKDTQVFCEVYCQSIGRKPEMHIKSNGARSLISRLPFFHEAIDKQPDPVLPEPIKFSCGDMESSSSQVSRYNPIIQSVTDFIMYVMVHELVDNHPVQGPRMLQTSLMLLRTWIRTKTPLLRGTFYDDKTRLMWVYTMRTSFPVCKTCCCEFGRLSNIHVSKSYDAYQPHCSSRCARLDKEAMLKYERSSMERFGASHPMGSSRVREKARMTIMARYGVDHLMHDPNHVSKIIGKRNSNQRIENRPKADGLVFDSGWEKEFYEFCKKNGLEVKYHPCAFKYSLDGVDHFYYPDFMVSGKLYEVKAPCFIKKDGTWTMPFRKKEWDEDTFLLYCRQAEAKRQCAVRNGVVILDNVDNNYLREVLGVRA